MIELSSTDRTTIGFKIHVEGSVERPIARFFVKITEDIQLVFPAEVINDKAIVNVPALNFLATVDESELPASLEVIIDNNYFVPWQGTATLKTPVRIQANLEKSDVKFKKNRVDLSSISVTVDGEEIDQEDYETYEEGTKEDSFKEYLKNKPIINEEIKKQEKKSDFSDFLKKKGI